MKIIIKCLYKAMFKTVTDDGIEHSGYMSFMILLALFPFIMFLLALTSFFGASELGEKFVKIVIENLPPQSIDSLRFRISEITKAPPQSLLTMAIVGSIWTASSFLEGIRTILNKIYKVTKPPSYILRRLLSIMQFVIMSIIISFIMLLFIIIPILLAKVPMLAELINTYIAKNFFFLDAWRYLLLSLSLTLITIALYYVIPNIKLTLSEVIPGALLTALLWMLSGYLLSKYLMYYNQLNVIYGSLGSIVVTLFFFYVINVIFIYGAEFNYLLAKAKNNLTNQQEIIT